MAETKGKAVNGEAKLTGVSMELRSHEPCSVRAQETDPYAGKREAATNRNSTESLERNSKLHAAESWRKAADPVNQEYLDGKFGEHRGSETVSALAALSRRRTTPPSINSLATLSTNSRTFMNPSSVMTMR